MSVDEPEQKPSSMSGYYSEVSSELCLLSIKRGKYLKEKGLSNKGGNNFLIKKAPVGAFRGTANLLTDIFQATHIWA